MKRMSVIVFVLVSTSVLTQSNPLVSLPFTIENHCIYLYCGVNQTDSVRFLFDTGADGSVINRQSLHKLPLKPDGKSWNQGSNGINEVENSSGNKIRIGTILNDNVSFTIIPFGTNTFDGIIGTDLMKEYIIEVDYQKQVLNFYKKDDKTINYEGFVKLKLYSDTYPTYIKSTMIVGGKKYNGFFGLDTGADDALTIAAPFAKKKDFINKMTKIGTAGFQGSDGSHYEMPIVLLPEMEFAKKHLYHIPTALSNATEGIDSTEELAGFFGNAFLKKFNVILDYNNKAIYFKLNHNLYQGYYE